MENMNAFSVRTGNFVDGIELGKQMELSRFKNWETLSEYNKRMERGDLKL